MTWKPHVTVAAIIEADQRFLLVEELIDGQRVLNQPAGHLEQDESLLDAVTREVLEETGYTFTPTSFVGTYLWKVPHSSRTYLRFAIAGSVGTAPANPVLNEGIIGTCWKTQAEIIEAATRLRSPLVRLSLDDYLNGIRQPLGMLRHIP